MYNNYYGNNNFNGGGYYSYGNPQQQKQQHVLKQTLSKEEVNHLRAKGDKEFNLMVTDDERLRQICNHKDPDTNNIALVRNNDGTFTCSICGERFSVLSDITKEQAEEICMDYNDLVQTAKTFYEGIPTDVGRELYQTFSFIKKMPQFWEVAMDYADKLNGNQMLDRNGNANAFASLNMLTNPAYQPMMPMQGGYYQQPMQSQQGGYYQPQPQQMPQQPMMQAGMYQQPQPQMMAPQQQMPMQQGTNYYQQPATNNGGYYDAGMPNPGVDRPIGVVDPTAQQQPQAQQPVGNQIVQQTLSAGPSPMAQPQKSQVPNTGDVKKNFKA